MSQISDSKEDRSGISKKKYRERISTISPKPQQRLMMILYQRQNHYYGKNTVTLNLHTKQNKLFRFYIIHDHIYY